MIFWMIYLFWASVRFLLISLTLMSGIPFFCCDTLSGVFFFNRDRECLIIRFTTATESSFTGNPLTQKSVTWKTERPYFMRVPDAFCRLNCRLLSKGRKMGAFKKVSQLSGKTLINRFREAAPSKNVWRDLEVGGRFSLD